MATNPLKIDPTQTGLLRKAFLSEVRKKFAELKRAVVQLIVTDDALGLIQQKPAIVVNADRQRWRFMQSDQKVDAFNEWLQAQVDSKMLATPKGATPWTAKYVESAYKKGLVRAYTQTNKATMAKSPDFYAGSQAEFLRSSFGAPESMSKVRLLGTRSFTQLKGVTDQMGSKMNRVMAEGIAHGKGPRQIARELADAIDVSKSRAETIARTELAYAHSEGQLDGFVDLGVEDVGIMAEWLTAGDDRVCPVCSELEGVVMKVDEARGMIPRHPNCVLGSSHLIAPDILSIFKARYNGRIIQIATAKGRRLSVTEHHILLTQRGWTFAKDFRKGDKLFDATGSNGVFLSGPNNYNGVPTIENVFDSLSKSCPVESVSSSDFRPENFHGDGSSIDKEIYVVRVNGKLRSNTEVKQGSEISKDYLMFGLQDRLALNGEGLLPTFLEWSASTADSFVRSDNVAAILARTSIGHHESICLDLIAKRDACKKQSMVNGSATAFELPSKCIAAFAFSILPDEVVNVDIITQPPGASIFVYDIHTKSTAYLLEGIVSSNCRCAWIPALSDQKEKGQKRSKSDIKSAIAASAREETGAKGNKEALSQSRWSGVDAVISKNRTP